MLAERERGLVERGNPGLRALLHLAQGEIAFAAGDLPAARAQFAKASALWTDDLPDPESVEARAYLGLIDGLAGRKDQGRTLVRQSLAKAEAMGHVGLQEQCRRFLAQIDAARN